MANIINQYGQVKLGVRYVSAPLVSSYPLDTDAQAFITAAAINGATQQSAINTLVTNLKTAGIWTKMKAIYPFVGGTAAQHRFNLKSPGTTNADFYLDFLGGGTHSATGYLPNGNSYADTKLAPSTTLSLNSTHFSYYSRTNNTVSTVDMGVSDASFQNALYANLKDGGRTYFRMNRSSGNPESNFPISDSRLFYIFNRVSSTQESVFTNTTKNTNSVNSSGLAINKFYIGCFNSNGTPLYYGSKECAFASIGDGLTDAEATAFYNAVQAYQTTLGRAV